MNSRIPEEDAPWALLAASWEELFPLRPARVEMALALSREGAATLDAGCATGSLPRALADRGRSFGDSPVELQIRRTARQHSVPCVAASPGDVSIEHWVGPPAGWIAYRVEAGPMETVKARLRGDHEAWFSVKAVTKWGELGEGMLQNRIPTGNPEATFINRKPEAVTFFFVVDTTTSLSGKEPYTLTLTRVPTASAKR